MIPERIRSLWVSIGATERAGQLLKNSNYEFRYLVADENQDSVALLMPARRRLTWTDGDLFPPMDQNLPEGDLYMRIRSLYPKQPLTPMHLLALIGVNGIGRLGFELEGYERAQPSRPISKQELIETRYSPAVFNDLVAAYLSTGIGIAGVQPKIMVPDRPTIPIPSVIVKAASESYPNLVANEFLCLTAARRAGIAVPEFQISHDGQMLILDRFDMVTGPNGVMERLGYEDIAALAGLRVRDVLSDRKYHGSYQRVAELLKQLQLPMTELQRFFEQVAFSVWVRNGDAHLKNFGVLYRNETGLSLAPMFDVVTTTLYRYSRYPGGPAMTDRTLALKLFAGPSQSKLYPTPQELMDFGRRICGVQQPGPILERIAQALKDTLAAARGDERIPTALLKGLEAEWLHP